MLDVKYKKQDLSATMGLMTRSWIKLAVSSLGVLCIAFLAFHLVGNEDCDGCYRLDEGEFIYIVYDDLPKSLVADVSSNLANAREQLLEYFWLGGMQKVVVKIWGDEAGFLAEQEKAIGKRYPGSFGYAAPINDETKREIGLLQKKGQTLSQTALHEYVHLITLEVNPKFANNPRWLWEAIAIYKSEDNWHYAATPDLVISRFDSLAQQLYSSHETGAIYEIGYTIGEYIEKTWGDRAFVNLIKSNGDFSELTSKPVDVIFQDWKKFVEDTYFSGSQAAEPNNFLLPTIFPGHSTPPK